MGLLTRARRIISSGDNVGAPARYAVAVLCTAAAWGIRAALDPLLGDVVPFAISFVAVLAMGWWGGWRPAVLTAVLSYLVGDYYFVQPRGTLLPRTVPETTACVLFVLVSGTIVCVTEQLRRAHRRLSLTLEGMEEGFRTLDRHWRYTYVNAAASRALQKTPDQMVGRDIWEVFPEPVRTLWLERARAAMEQRVPVEFELHYSPLDRWFEYKCYPTLEGIAVFSKDITGRKQADQALRQAQAQLAETNASLERLVQERTAKLTELVGELEHMSYGIVHDLRAPSRAVAGYADLVQQIEADKLSPESKTYLERMKAAAKRMDDLARDALKYGRILRDQPVLQAVDLEPLLHAALASYPELQPPRAEIDIAPALPPVLANEGMLSQCLLNLLDNAVKFAKPGQLPRVQVKAERHDQKVRIWIIDNGIGIEAQVRRRIFDMFQRGTNAHEGTGIGLAIVRKAAERMGGKVGVESEPGKGSRFWVELKAPPA